MISISHSYKIDCLQGEIGRIIGAPASLCEKEYRRLPSELPLGEYIWCRNYTRGHYRKDIDLPDGFTKVLAEFQCDNRIEIYINGTKAYDSLDFFPIGEKVSTGALDLSGFFAPGINKIAIRAYQTGTFERFLSAMRGAFAIFSGERVTYVKTDSSFSYVTVCSFWDNKEDDGWEVSDSPRSSAPADTYPAHPHTLRRSVYLRKKFEVKKGLVRATLRATAYGLYQPYVNGKVATDERFLPGAMDGCKEYRDLDITPLLKSGTNAVGAIIANGWYNCTAFGILSTNRLGFAAEVILDYGTFSEIIPTDSSWLCALSPIFEDDLQFGERYDARLEIPGWCEPGCDESVFVSAEEFEISHPAYVLQNYPPIRVTKTLQPLKKWDIGGNRVIFDMGTNNAARGSLTVRNTKSGDAFCIRYAERLTDGEPHLGVYGDVYYISDTFRDGCAKGALRNCDRYICKGAGTEVYEPEFTYTGFRYIYVEYPEGYDPEGISVQARVIHNDLEICGSVKTSYAPLSGIWDMICRSFRSNTVGGPTDCPTREKNFWNGDILAFCNTAMWYADVDSYLSRWTHMGRKIQYNIYGWEDEEYLLPYKLYKFYGNLEILRTKYGVMLRLVEKREKQYAEAGGFPKESARYRDHLSLVNVSHDFFAFCWHTYMYAKIAEISEILGMTEKAAELRASFEKWRQDFNSAYFLEAENDYSEHCQGGIILPVMLGLAPEEKIPALTEKLVDYIKKDKGPTTGFFTTEYLLTILSEHGYTDLAHDIMTRDTFPSWLYLLKTGSTTITESWYGEAAPYDESMNHYAFGSVGRYFFESLGGLKEHSGDMTHFVISPEICEKIGDFGVSYKTPHGVVSTYWKISKGEGELTVTLPAGVSADIRLPDGGCCAVSKAQTEQKHAFPLH